MLSYQLGDNSFTDFFTRTMQVWLPFLDMDFVIHQVVSHSMYYKS